MSVQLRISAPFQLTGGMNRVLGSYQLNYYLARIANLPADSSLLQTPFTDRYEFTNHFSSNNFRR
jgi:hypothetical protein